MSGGTFDYKQFMLSDIADTIEEAIAHNNAPPAESWDDHGGNGLLPHTIARFALAAATCRLAEAMAMRVDWLLACDDGEDDFHERWIEEVEPLAGKMMAAAERMARELRKAGR